MKNGEKALYQVQDEYVAVLEQRGQRTKRNQDVYQANFKARHWAAASCSIGGSLRQNL
jgi:hypothetical protein